MRSIDLVARLLLGGIFVVAGLNELAPVIRLPEMTRPGTQFVELLRGSGYLYVVTALEIGAAALLLFTRRRTLALALLGPIVVNILLFHVFLDRPNLLPALAIATVWGYLAWRHRTRFLALVAPDS